MRDVAGFVEVSVRGIVRDNGAGQCLRVFNLPAVCWLSFFGVWLFFVFVVILLGVSVIVRFYQNGADLQDTHDYELRDLQLVPERGNCKAIDELEDVNAQNSDDACPQQAKYLPERNHPLFLLQLRKDALHAFIDTG